jgi:hypothetical protein
MKYELCLVSMTNQKHQYYKDLNICQLIYNSSAEAHLHLVWYSAVNMQDLNSAMIKRGVLLSFSSRLYRDRNSMF